MQADSCRVRLPGGVRLPRLTNVLHGGKVDDKAATLPNTSEPGEDRWFKCLTCGELHVVRVVKYHGMTAIKADLGYIVPRRGQSLLVYCAKCGAPREFRGMAA